MQRSYFRRPAAAPRRLLLPYLCLVGFVLAAICLTQRWLTQPEGPDAPAPREASGALALKRAQVLCQRLEPTAAGAGDSASLTLERVVPYGMGTKPIPPNEEWVIQRKGTVATSAFTVAYDADTGTFKHLIWTAPWYVAPGVMASRAEGREGEPAGEASGRDLLTPARAVAATIRTLHRLEVPEAEGPWKVLSAHRGFPTPNSPAYKEWRVALASPRWYVQAALDADSGEMLQIFVVPPRREEPEPGDQRELSLHPGAGGPSPASGADGEKGSS
jgi:hypothetical protein